MDIIQLIGAEMKLWKIFQDANNDYDTYDSAIVAAESAEKAKEIHPYGDAEGKWWEGRHVREWVKPEYVKVEYIGEAAVHIKEGVILASFNSG